MKIVAIIQARMTSKRLPGKALVDIAGKPALLHVVQRCRASGMFDDTVVATSQDAPDTPIAALCSTHDIPVFRGSLENVLQRYYDAAVAYHADVITRITADCPLIDPDIVRRTVEFYLHHRDEYDYVNNALEGLSVEVFPFTALEAAHRAARSTFELEHVTPYFYQHPERFRLGKASFPTDLSHIRWSLDTPEDLQFIRSVFDHVGREIFGVHDVLAVVPRLPAHPPIPHATI